MNKVQRLVRKSPQSNSALYTEFLPPTTEKYISAFEAIKNNLSSHHKAILKAHYRSLRHRSTANDLALDTCRSRHSYLLLSANIGRMLAEQLDIAIPTRPNNSNVASAVIGKWEKYGNYWYCTLYPEVATALEKVGLI
jgi:hypothetical protein